jgi:hypothetical protein
MTSVISFNYLTDLHRRQTGQRQERDRISVGKGQEMVRKRTGAMGRVGKRETGRGRGRGREGGGETDLFFSEFIFLLRRIIIHTNDTSSYTSSSNSSTALGKLCGWIGLRRRALIKGSWTSLGSEEAGGGGGDERQGRAKQKKGWEW